MTNHQYDDPDPNEQSITPRTAMPIFWAYECAVRTFIESGDTGELAAFTKRRFVFETEPDVIARAALQHGCTRPGGWPK
jgi:hypothetical protein